MEYGVTDADGTRPNIWQYFREKMPQFAFKKLDDTFYSYFENVNYEAFEAEVKKEVRRAAKR